MFVGAGSSLFMRVWGIGKMKVVEALVLVWVESRGVCRSKEIWGEGKERTRRCPSFFFYWKICGCVGAIERWFFDRDCF